MSKLILAALCGLMLAASPLALAQEKAKKEPTEAQKKQQQRMADCNKQAGAKKLEGDARKKFMSTCLSGEGAGPTAAQKKQQQRMADCNKEAGTKKLEGEARKKFMSACLKG
ncbi:MAG: PsiF family protein [Burkholderiales bacterium]